MYWLSNAINHVAITPREYGGLLTARHRGY